MLILIIGLFLFLGIHSISIIAEDFRNSMVAKSKNGWKIIYSLISVVGIVLIAKGYTALRFEPVLLYVPPYWFKASDLLADAASYGTFCRALPTGKDKTSNQASPDNCGETMGIQPPTGKWHAG